MHSQFATCVRQFGSLGRVSFFPPSLIHHVFIGGVVGAFFSLASILGECSTIYFLPSRFFFFLSGD